MDSGVGFAVPSSSASNLVLQAFCEKLVTGCQKSVKFDVQSSGNFAYLRSLEIFGHDLPFLVLDVLNHLLYGFISLLDG